MIWRLSLRGRPPRGFGGSAGRSGPMRSQSVSGTVAKRASMGRAFHQISLNRAKFPDRLLAREERWCGGCSMGVMQRAALVRELFQTLRAGVAGVLATAIDLAVLTVLVSGFHVDPRVASVPALVAGGIANFVGNRHFAFRARAGSVVRQAALYTAVEVLALGYGGLLYDTALRLFPAVRPLYWAVRLVTSHVVFLTWSYPLWRRVFAIPQASAASAS